MKLADLYMHLRPDIKKIEEELERAVDADHPVLREASLHLLKAGGKRIRPVLLLLAAQYGTYNIDRLKHICVALELTHMGSLVHDDVIDDADLRRGKKTIKAQWDNRVAMYTGDYIFAKAVEKANHFNNTDIHKVMSNTLVEMCIGEIEQIRDQYDWNQHFRVYLRRIKRKTALLIAVSCQLGAIAGGAGKEEQFHLYRYGYNVGMSYQIIDDILDFTGTEKQLGKPAGSDLMQGNVTLPALYAMHHTPEMRQQIVRFCSKDQIPKEELHEMIQVIRKSGGIEYSREISERYLHKAFHSLAHLPDQSATRSLKKIAQYIGSRNY